LQGTWIATKAEQAMTLSDIGSLLG
jgi:hypothetical protein